MGDGWRTSTRSGGNGCVEVSLPDWRKSTRSGTNGCVEVARLPGGKVAVRDSKDRGGPVLLFTPREWTAFVLGVRGGEFDLR